MHSSHTTTPVLLSPQPQAGLYPEPPRPRTASGPARPPATRSLADMPSWQRLSRNRAAKRAADFTQQQHLSTLYHMHRRITEMYAKPGPAPRGEVAEAAQAHRNACRPATSPYLATG